jgi:CelD/BcsL family acetyltransferase involved in cellulose biosynthesis
MTGRYTIERLSSPDQLQKLGKSWDALVERIPGGSFFLGRDWITTWWANFQEGKELWLLTAQDSHGDLAGIVPLFRSSYELGPLSLRRLSFMGSGIAGPVHLDLLADEADDLAAAFLDYLHAHRRDWDLLDLQALREESTLKARIFAAPGSFLLLKTESCGLATLPSTWEAFQNQQMSAKLRKTIRYYQRRLEKEFPAKVAFRSPETDVELDRALDFLLEHSRRAHRQAGRSSSFESEPFCRFFRAVVHAAFQGGSLRLYQLLVDGQTIAVQQGFCFKGAFYGYQTAYDQEWRQYSPGQQLLSHLFQEAIGEHLREVDMAHGETDYKKNWETDARVNCHLLYACGKRGRLWLAGMRCLAGMANCGRKILPDDVRQRIGRLLRIESLVS